MIFNRVELPFNERVLLRLILCLIEIRKRMSGSEKCQIPSPALSWEKAIGAECVSGGRSREMDNSEINKMHESLRKAVEEENLQWSRQLDLPKIPPNSFLKEPGTTDRELVAAIGCCEALKRILRGDSISALIEYGESRGLTISRLMSEDVAYIREEKCEDIIGGWLSDKKMSGEITFGYNYDIAKSELSPGGIGGVFKMMSFNRTEKDYIIGHVDLRNFRDGVNMYINRAERNP